MKRTSDIEAQFERCGYVEICEGVPTRDDYDGLYRSFDTFVEAVGQDPAVESALNESGRRWLSSRNTSMWYSGVPPKFEDRTRRDDKAEKLYCQASQEYVEYCRSRNPVLYQVAAVCALYEHIEQIIESAVPILLSVIDQLTESNPGLRDRLYAPHRYAPVILRVIRYHRTTNFGTQPHVDKSGLSLVLDNSDSRLSEKLVIASNKRPTELTLADLHSPRRRCPGSAILIPGRCLQDVGFLDLPPSPHAVLPMDTERRHSVIAFWLVPNFSMDQLITDVPFKQCSAEISRRVGR